MFLQCLDDARGTLFLARDALVPTATPCSEFFFSEGDGLKWS